MANTPDSTRLLTTGAQTPSTLAVLDDLCARRDALNTEGTVARWHGPLQRFVHWRSKFGERFLEEIRYPEDEPNYDVFMPEQELSVDAVLATNSLISDEKVQRFFSR